MHTVIWTNRIGIQSQINTFVLNHVSCNGYQLIWKTLNMVDRLSLSDTDERVGVMRKKLLHILITMAILIQVVQLKGLTTGPKWSSIGISNRKDNNE